MDQSTEVTVIEREHCNGISKLVDEMGYPEKQAKRALALCDNDVETAVHYLEESMETEEGYDDEHATGAALRRYMRQHYGTLRKLLLQNPAKNDVAIAALLQKEGMEPLGGHVKTNSVDFLQMLLESSSDEDDSDNDRKTKSTNKTKK